MKPHRIWRTGILLLILICVFVASIYRPPVEVISVLKQQAQMVSEGATRDLVSPLYWSNDGTVHLHSIAPNWRCKLHMHSKTDEATVIVDGSADVTQFFAKNGNVVQESERCTPGVIIASPKFCGHEWINPSAQVRNANLVFTRPKFSGNEWIKAEDAKIRNSQQPLRFHVLDAWRDFASSQEDHRSVVMPGIGDPLQVHFIRKQFQIQRGFLEPTIVYVIAGTGTIDAIRSAHLEPATLAIVHWAPSVRIHASSPMAILVFRPEHK